MWTVTLDIYFKGTPGISHDWDCHYISLSLWRVVGKEVVSSALNADCPHSHIFPLLPDLLGDPSQTSWELISICYKWERWHFSFSWPEAQSYQFELHISSVSSVRCWRIIWLFRYFSSFGFTRENTSERPALEFETLLESTFNVTLPNPGFSITPHKLTSDSVSVQGHHGSLGRFSHWLLN